MGLIAAVVSIASYAQQHDHDEHHNGSQISTDDVAIFCPTMKTGQLCTHDSANVLGLTGGKQEKWVEIAQKYDRVVDAATLQLFKDAESDSNGPVEGVVRRFRSISAKMLAYRINIHRVAQRSCRALSWQS